MLRPQAVAGDNRNGFLPGVFARAPGSGSGRKPLSIRGGLSPAPPASSRTSLRVGDQTSKSAIGRTTTRRTAVERRDPARASRSPVMAASKPNAPGLTTGLLIAMFVLPWAWPFLLLQPRRDVVPNSSVLPSDETPPRRPRRGSLRVVEGGLRSQTQSTSLLVRGASHETGIVCRD
jgi:hypothetical protein